MAYKENILMNDLMLAASQRGDRLWRNQMGKYRDDKSGAWITYGLQNPGGSDLIGFTRVVVTPDMVGQTVAVFTAVEAKTGRLKPTEDQERFIRMVQEKGGLATWGTEAQAIQLALKL